MLNDMNRDQALTLVHEWTVKPALITHMLAVEAVMRQLASHFGQDSDAWGLAGLLHDFDYERFVTVPDHPVKGSEVLAEHGVDDHTRQAILGHANLPEYPRQTDMAKALFAADELTGLVMAVTYVRPSKSIMDVEVSSVKKKIKDKTFAAGVNRDDIRQGAEELGLELDALIAIVIEGLKKEAGALGLAGNTS
jgi:putative nucleotidyltransferase with HDIG domain